MTNPFHIIKVPYGDNIFVNHIHAALQGVVSEVSTRSKVTPISYACKEKFQDIHDAIGYTDITHDFAQL
jgi:mannose-6-phosphate isomerase class I